MKDLEDQKRHFNSIKVRLKHTTSIVRRQAKCYFNSIKVRLKHDGALVLVPKLAFQFHKGTIKTGGGGDGDDDKEISIP